MTLLIVLITNPLTGPTGTRFQLKSQPSGAATVPLGASNTMIVNWFMAQGDPAAGGNVAATLRVVSDQPVAAGTNIQFSGFHPMPCTVLPR